MSLYELAKDSIKNIKPSVQSQPKVEEFRTQDTSENGQPSAGPRDMYKALTKYLPTETITLYIAAMGIATTLKKEFFFMNETFLYWFFAILTPIIFILILFAERKLSKKKKIFPPKSEWPIWKLTASFIAFLAWAQAVPNSPYLQSDGGKILAAFLALFISTILSLLEPIFEKKVS